MPTVRKPYAETRAAQFLEKRIEQLQSRKSQREIAQDIGFAQPQALSMMKTGELKIPLDRVPAFARALEVDAANLFRMVLEQHLRGEELTKTINEIFGVVVSKNERQFIELIRNVSNDTDPALTDKLAAELTTVLQENLPATTGA
jgi:predicted HAD superfamily phosphohydrolase